MSRLAGLLFVSLSLLAGPAAAQPYPSQTIRIIAPFPPGGSVDIMARLIAEPIARALRGNIIVENRSGASGNLGMEAAARAKPDGYTLVLNTIPLATNHALFDKLTWSVKDFTPISYASAGTPRITVNQLNAAVRATLTSKEMHDKMLAQGFNPFITTPEAAGTFIDNEVVRFSKLIKARKITAE